MSWRSKESPHRRYFMLIGNKTIPIPIKLSINKSICGWIYDKLLSMCILCVGLTTSRSGQFGSLMPRTPKKPIMKQKFGANVSHDFIGNSHNDNKIEHLRSVNLLWFQHVIVHSGIRVKHPTNSSRFSVLVFIAIPFPHMKTLRTSFFVVPKIVWLSERVIPWKIPKIVSSIDFRKIGCDNWWVFRQIFLPFVTFNRKGNIFIHERRVEHYMDTQIRSKKCKM